MNSAATLPLPSNATEKATTPAPPTCCPVCDSAPAYLTSRNLCPTTLPRRY